MEVSCPNRNCKSNYVEEKNGTWRCRICTIHFRIYGTDKEIFEEIFEEKKQG